MFLSIFDVFNALGPGTPPLQSPRVATTSNSPSSSIVATATTTAPPPRPTAINLSQALLQGVQG